MKNIFNLNKIINFYKKSTMLYIVWALCIAAVNTQTAQAQLNITLGSQINYTDNVSDIWGYTDAVGNEYALVCLQTGLAVVDVTDPANPVELHFISGPNNTWRDVHTWGQYAYMVTESSASGGLLVLDLSGLPATVGVSYTDMGFGYYSAHTLYIDENGIGYLFGAKSTGQGNATFFIDIAANPLTPTYLGKYTAAYVHDAYVRNDTMWTCEIYAGRFAVVDVSNKAAPVVMATQATPGAFTHASWLSDNSQYLFVTDEVNAASVTAYDVSDISDIKEVDRYKTKPVSDPNVIPHNLYVRDNYLITSYYTSGITIADITYPYNIIEVGNYDTSPSAGGGFNGCWGVYPYFDSTNILATDRQEGLFVLSPTYQHACWLEGTVSNALNNSPIIGATVSINLVEAGTDNTDFQGFYATGTATAGTYQVVASAAGFKNDTLTITLTNGVLSVGNFNLVPLTYCSTAPATLNVTQISSQNATLHWKITPDAAAYKIAYRPVGSTDWNYTTTATSDTFWVAGTLQACNDYEWQVQAICQYGQYSPYSATDTFTTTPPNADWTAPTQAIQECEAAPTDLSNNITGQSGGTWSGGSYISPSGLFNPNNLNTGDYSVTYTVGQAGCTGTQTHTVPVAACTTTGKFKVFLGGCYVGSGTMATKLRQGNLLPLQQPYNIAPWHYMGSESAVSLPANAVDWVLVELRNAADNTIIEAQAAGLLLNNGSIVNANDLTDLTFVGIEAGSYFVIVRHRNHLAVMSAQPVNLPNTTQYDFTSTVAATFGVQQTYNIVGSTVFAMRPGDIDANGLITVADYNQYEPQISAINVYQTGDLNLDRSVTVSDFNLYLPNSSFIGILQVRYP